jgi:hypothetical protein
MVWQRTEHRTVHRAQTFCLILSKCKPNLTSEIALKVWDPYCFFVFH